MKPECSGWGDEDNAEQYHAYARRFAMYRTTTELLLHVAGPLQRGPVMDLACGTGASTGVIANACRHRITAVDASASMLRIAAREHDDPRIRWFHGGAEHLTVERVGIHHAVLCNAALWQMNIDAVAERLATIVEPGGLFAFTLTHQHTRFDLEARRGALDLDEVAGTIVRHGFTLEKASCLDVTRSANELRCFASIPVMRASASADPDRGDTTVRWLALAFRRGR